MDINFEAPTEEGVVRFKGSLTNDETNFLLQFALMTLLQRGMLPATVVFEQAPLPEEIVVDKKDLN